MIERHKTALKRYKLSRPLLLLTQNNLLTNKHSFFDYGCGHGSDTEILCKNGFKNIKKYDPFYFPHEKLVESDVVNLGYVLNVIENPEERIDTLRKAFRLAKNSLCVSVMVRTSNNSPIYNKYSDGEVSTRNTFQKYFEQSEFKNYLESILKVDAIPLEPGIFVVFKNEMAKLEFLANRYRKRIVLEITKLDKPTGKLKKVKVLRKNIKELIFESPFFKPTLQATEALGRLPYTEEFESYKLLLEEYKSKKKIQECILENINEDRFLDSRSQRIEEILVFLALRRFDRLGFPKKKDLPQNLALDIDHFFKNYRDALKKAEALLFSIGNETVMFKCFKAATIGKQLPQALYIHETYIHTLPAPLQVKVGVAKSLLGNIENSSILKINKVKDKVSFLVYEDFNKVAHPALRESYSVDLKRNEIDYWDFSSRDNPPILHRKETFIGADHPKFNLFSRLTKKEESFDLLSSPSIGTREKWNQLLASNGLKISGHQLRKIE